MATIATACQSKVQLILLLDGLCNGAKTISVQLKEKNSFSRDQRFSERRNVDMLLSSHNVYIIITKDAIHYDLKRSVLEKNIEKQ